MTVKIIYLIGFMGSGKSTVGRKLAASLSWSFVDLDRKIEEKAGKSIASIFSQDGEKIFRETESEVLRNLDIKVNTVVSTGGGTPCHGDNMDYMKGTGLTVYLKMEPAQLAGRLLESSKERPLLKEISDEDLPSFISDKLALREKWYNRADIIFKGMNADIKYLHSLIELHSKE
jgi:shikimate kinase